MEKKLYSSIIVLSTIFILFQSCKKEGPVGPAGKDGNANVQSSTITFSNWSWESTSKYEYCDFTWPSITSSIANSGAVIIYISTPSGWVALPRTIYPNTTYSESQRFYYNIGSFRIIVQDSDLSPPAALGTWTIKVVAIESSGIKTNPNLDFSDYSAVKLQFGLAD